MITREFKIQGRRDHPYQVAKEFTPGFSMFTALLASEGSLFLTK